MATQSMAMPKPKRKSLARQRKDILFYVLLMAWPVLQFCVFYIGVNFNSFLLAFEKIDATLNVNDPNYITFDFGFFRSNILDFLKMDFMTDGVLKPAFWTMVSTSVLAWVFSVCISVPLGLFFSYYISKKMPLHGAFRVILFLPSILSSVVMVTMFKQFVGSALIDFVRDYFNVEMDDILARGADTAFGVCVFYSIWVSFGTSVLMYSNSMSEISPEIIESARLDGANSLQEFWHITLPSVFPTLSVFLVTGVAGIFTNQLNLYSLYGGNSGGLLTVGYYLYINTSLKESYASQLPSLSSFGIILSAVAIPLTLGTRYLLEKFGPSED